MRAARLQILVLLLPLTWGIAENAVAGDSEAESQVVIVVDTSRSMAESGMDPQRRSLLVTRLFADLVEGKLAVVRLLDLSDDASLLPSRPTGRMVPCDEDPTRMCEVVEQTSDWSTAARDEQLGLLNRFHRGDTDFKRQLADHLKQRSDNSPFAVAFHSARGFFAEHVRERARKTVIWLSDGRAETPDAAHRALQDLKREGVRVEAIVFGRGDTELATRAGVSIHRVDDAAELMRAFADAFRRIVQAPYRVDRRLTDSATFTMKPAVDEAWVVIYGEDTLREAGLQAPDGQEVPADFARDQWPGAGAYRVAHIDDPTEGRWKVHATGGGTGTAYAVIQRSNLTPSLLEPNRTPAGVETRLVAEVLAGADGQRLTDDELLKTCDLTANISGIELPLRDDGRHGDIAAGDGRFTALHSFEMVGGVPVDLLLVTELVHRRVRETVEVTGRFEYRGGPISLDLGSLKAGEESCRRLELRGDHVGRVPFELVTERSLPTGHHLEVRSANGVLGTQSQPIGVSPAEGLKLCLRTAKSAPSSTSQDETWVQISVAGPQADYTHVPLRLSWSVEGLTFWERWGRWILLALGVILLVVVILGFVLPQRFKPTLALSFAPEREDLDEYSPQPISQWRGVGIGFYRDAQAFLHSDYRITGKPRGALAGLHAERGGTRVAPAGRGPLYRETLDGEWEQVTSAGKRGRSGDIFRVGDNGPYFRLSTRRGMD